MKRRFFPGFLIFCTTTMFAGVFAPTKGFSTWRDGESTWSYGRQEGKDPWAGADATPAEWGEGMTLSTKCADRSPHHSPASVVDFIATPGRYKVVAKGELRNQIPLAGYGKAEWIIVRASGCVRRLKKVETPMGENKGRISFDLDAVIELAAGDLLRLRVQTVNPGPAPADNTWLSLQEYRVDKVSSDTECSPLETIPMPMALRKKADVPLRPFHGDVGKAIAVDSDGPVLPEDVPDAMFESFETATPHYVFRKLRGHPEASVEERDGIAADGSRCLHIDLAPTKDPDPKGYHESGVIWEFEAPRDFSMYDAVTLKLRNATTSRYGMRLLFTETDGTIWHKEFDLSGDQPNVWQTVTMSTRFGRYHEGPPAPQGKDLCDLTRVKSVRLRLMGFLDKPVSFDLDAIGFIRRRQTYEGLSVVSFDGSPRLNPKTESFSFTAHITGEPMDEDVRGVFAAIDYFGTTNVLGEVTVPAGVADVSVPLSFPNPGACFGRVVGVLYGADGCPLQRKSRGYTSTRGLHPEDQGRNPDSIFGIWVGGGAPFEVGAKWRRTYVRAHELGTDGAIVETPRETPLRSYPPDCDEPLVFSYMPRWLSVKGPDDPDGRRYPAKDWKAYEKYIAWVTAATPGYELYEMWNEPVPYAYWMGTVEDLVPLAEATYKGMKSVKTEARLLGPCPYSFLIDFMEDFFKLGGNQWIDDVVVHGYTPGPPDIHFVKGLRDTRALMEKYGLGDRNLYITEMGYSTPSVTEEDMAAYIPRCYAYAWREGVKFMVWHNLEALSPDSVGFDLMWKDKTPRPGFTAYCAMTRELEGAKLIREIPGLPPSTVAFEFERRGTKTILFWDKEAARGKPGADVSFDVPEGTHPVLVDLMGGETPPKLVNGRVRLRAMRDAAYLRFDP